MPRIVATGTASPPNRLSREDVRRWARRLYGNTRRAELLLRLADGTGIERRALALPVEEVVRRRSFEVRNREFGEQALALAEQAARRALDRAHTSADRVDQVITTSCTGLLIPSLEALLAPRLGLRADAVRLPITELGCAAGAAALARAREHLLAFPGRVSLVIAVELTSLTFHVDDPSAANLVAGSIFGDGAAAAVVRDAPAPPGPDLVDACTHLFPDTAHLMGFRVGDDGLRIVLDREVPRYLSGRVRPLADALLAEHGLTVRDLEFAAIHPGGRRILAELERELELPAAALAPSWAVLRECGNMSSATVLFVLDRLWHRPPPRIGSYGLLAAFGPGFSAELALMQWQA